MGRDKHCSDIFIDFWYKSDKLNIVINYRKDEDMLSQIPIKIEDIKKEDNDKEILRAAIIAELDAINFL